MNTVYVSIGNSDGKLTQREYAEYIRDFRRIMRQYSSSILGEWFSAPDTAFQNACIVIQYPEAEKDALKEELTELRLSYNQDSVAWAPVEKTEFI
jgi:hypothetical protein